MLGEHCVPGCRTTEVDFDGTHLCVAVVGTVPARRYLASAHTIAVEVAQEQDPDGTVRRIVALVALDKNGRIDGDTVEVPAHALAALVELLTAALPLVGTR